MDNLLSLVQLVLDDDSERGLLSGLAETIRPGRPHRHAAGNHWGNVARDGIRAHVRPPGARLEDPRLDDSRPSDGNRCGHRPGVRARPVAAHPTRRRAGIVSGSVPSTGQSTARGVTTVKVERAASDRGRSRGHRRFR
jgi:hypothetical protein